MFVAPVNYAQNIDKDYYKVFPDRKTKKGEGKREEDHIYEVGEDGFDISS